MIDAGVLLTRNADNYARFLNYQKIFENFGILTDHILTTNSNINGVSVKVQPTVIEISFCHRTIALVLKTKIGAGKSYLNATVDLFHKQIDFSGNESCVPMLPSSLFTFDQTCLTNLNMPDYPHEKIDLSNDIHVTTLLLNILNDLLGQ